MELIPLLRVLWRRRWALLAGFVAACAIAVELAGSPVPTRGTAEVGVVVDTSRSQLTTGAPRGADTLWWRATLLAMLLGTDAQRARIAAEAHIPVSQLAVRDFELTAPAVAASLPSDAVPAANGSVEPYVITVRTDNVLPVVAVGVDAPDRAGAARVAQAAVHALAAGASPTETAELQGLSIQATGAVQSRTIPGGSGHKKMALAAAVLFILWCVALVTGPALRGIRRTLAETRAAAY